MSDIVFDPREYAYKAGLAADYMRGLIRSPKFLVGEVFQVKINVTSLKKSPGQSSEQVSELLFGEEIIIYEILNGWAWGQSQTDGYVGYVSMDHISCKLQENTHEVTALRAFVYKQPDIKASIITCLSMASQLSITHSRGLFAYIENLGWIFEKSIRTLGGVESDFVSVAQKFTGTPYLWGGRSSFGIDCSGLVQLSLRRVGVLCPRDTDQQASSVGSPVNDEITKLLRGDLIYVNGHVAIMVNPHTILHANAFHMSVELESLEDFLSRLKQDNIHIAQMRRPSLPSH